MHHIEALGQHALGERRGEFGEESRMSCPMTARVAPSARINRAKEPATSRTKAASICSPTTPRTSYALMTA